jgi:dipeptidase
MKRRPAACVIALCLFPLAYPGGAEACYTIVVGSKASADGAVLVGHNEVWGSGLINLVAVPREAHEPGSVIRLENGLTIPQVEQTWGFLWSSNPGVSACDSLMNEWGVCIVGNATMCRSELSCRPEQKGGMGCMLGRIVLQRAKTAREAVEVLSRLVGEHGFVGNKTRVIADAREAWIVSLGRGCTWVANRVPDDQVVLLPNVYVATWVDVKDKANCLASPDLIERAVKAGWFDPASGRRFSFRDVYGGDKPGVIDTRQRRGYYLMTGRWPELPEGGQLPFSVRPDRKLGVADVMSVLRDRAEGSICNDGTLEASVFQLRAGMPPAVGCVYWRASRVPDRGVFVPWYCGTTSVDASYSRAVAPDKHIEPETRPHPPRETSEPDRRFCWWKFEAFNQAMLKAPRDKAMAARRLMDRFEELMLAGQAETDGRAMDLYRSSPAAACEFLTRRSNEMGLKAVRLAEVLTRDLTRAATTAEAAK